MCKIIVFLCSYRKSRNDRKTTRNDKFIKESEAQLKDI